MIVIRIFQNVSIAEYENIFRAIIYTKFLSGKFFALAIFLLICYSRGFLPSLCFVKVILITIVILRTIVILINMNESFLLLSYFRRD